MPVIQNKLQDEQSIKDYKEWLSNKPNHYLKCLLNIFRRHIIKEDSVYCNLVLRIELVRMEIAKRLDNL